MNRSCEFGDLQAFSFVALRVYGPCPTAYAPVFQHTPLRIHVDAKLPCETVDVPSPKVPWRERTRLHSASERLGPTGNWRGYFLTARNDTAVSVCSGVPKTRGERLHIHNVKVYYRR